MPDPPRYAEVLVPTDGSDAAEAAVDHAITAAQTHNARIHALYVVDARITTAAAAETREELEESLAADGAAAVEAIEAAIQSYDLPVTKTIERGTPSKQILEYADANGIDLIVMGSAGKSPREKLIRLGSVSERVVESSQVPVLVVPRAPT